MKTPQVERVRDGLRVKYKKILLIQNLELELLNEVASGILHLWQEEWLKFYYAM